MTTKKSVIILIAAVCGLTTCAALGAWLGGDYDLSWCTIDGGGGSNNTGGEFSLSTASVNQAIGAVGQVPWEAPHSIGR